MKIVVIQADRDAAADWESIINHRWSEYEGDAVEDLVQAFARHRIEALEQAAKLIEDGWTELKTMRRYDGPLIRDLPQAIRNLQGEG